MVVRRGKILGKRRGRKKKYMQGGRMGFLFIRKMASMGSSSTGALVAVGSLQPPNPTEMESLFPGDS